MLKKLIKYDLKPVLKFISVFYILGIFFALLTRIFFSIENSFMMNILGQITNGATISMLISILINNLMRFWVRFKNTIYDDESYLIHTLPVNKKTLYLSKFITSLIVVFISMLVSVFILFIAYYSKENMELLKNTLLSVANILNINMFKLIITFVFIFFLELFSILMCGYLGMIIGHRFNNKKILYSIVFGFISYVLTQLIVLLTIFIVAVFNKDIMNLFTSNVINNINVLNTLSYLSIIVYSLLIAINLIVSIKIFEKGVNVD